MCNSPAVEWYLAEKRGEVKVLPEGKYKDATEWLEYLKASMRAKVEHPSQVVKLQFAARWCTSRDWRRTPRSW